MSDVVASTVQPRLQLKRFDRVMIRKGETRRVTFTLTADDFSIINRQMQRVVEPGSFLIMVGPASDHILLQEAIEY